MVSRHSGGSRLCICDLVVGMALWSTYSSPTLWGTYSSPTPAVLRVLVFLRVARQLTFDDKDGKRVGCIFLQISLLIVK